jgi:hypothetical protein
MSSFSEILDKAFEATAWEMIPPPAYGAFHLSFTIIGISLRFLLGYKLRNISERGNKIVLFDGDESLVGQFVNIKITKAQTFALIGEIVG